MAAADGSSMQRALVSDKIRFPSTERGTLVYLTTSTRLSSQSNLGLHDSTSSVSMTRSDKQQTTPYLASRVAQTVLLQLVNISTNIMHQVRGEAGVQVQVGGR